MSLALPSVLSFDLSSTITQGFDTVVTTAVPSHAQSLREKTVAVRISFTMFGKRKTLSKEAKENVAQEHGADARFLGMTKDLFGNHKAFARMATIRNKIRKLWLSRTLPFPEDGIRLLRRDDLPAFRHEISVLINEFKEAIPELDNHLEDIKAAMKQSLGEFYNPSDYPDTFSGKFNAELSFPNVELPSYLSELDPESYNAEKARVTALFEQALIEGRNELIKQLESMLSHMVDMLTTGEDGKPKRFHESAIGNLRDFFEKFKGFNLGNDAKLDSLVNEAKDIVGGITKKQIKSDAEFSEMIRAKLSDMTDRLGDMMINRPKRKLTLDLPAPTPAATEEQSEVPSEDFATVA